MTVIMMKGTASRKGQLTHYVTISVTCKDNGDLIYFLLISIIHFHMAESSNTTFQDVSDGNDGSLDEGIKERRRSSTVVQDETRTVR